MFEQIFSGDSFSAVIGLCGTIFGSIITLVAAKIQANRDLRKQLALQRQDVFETQLESKKHYLMRLRETQDYCFKVESWLMRIQGVSHKKMIAKYEETGVYPSVSIVFIETPSALLSSAMNGILADLYANISLYNSLIGNNTISKEHANRLLNEIYEYAMSARSILFDYSNNCSQPQIQKAEREEIMLLIERNIQLELGMLGKKRRKERCIQDNSLTS